MRRQDGCYITSDVEVVPEELMLRKMNVADLKKEDKEEGERVSQRQCRLS